MSNKINISIFDIVKEDFCALPGQGNSVFEVLDENIRQNKHVTISFKNINLVTPTFLNVAIGQLYGKHDWDKLKKLLSVDIENTDPEDIKLIKRVVDNAKHYFERQRNKNGSF